MPQTTDLVPSKDVCERLDIDRSTLSRWVSAGRITPAIQLPGANGAFLFAAADVAALEAIKAGDAA